MKILIMLLMLEEEKSTSAFVLTEVSSSGLGPNVLQGSAAINPRPLPHQNSNPKTLTSFPPSPQTTFHFACCIIHTHQKKCLTDTNFVVEGLLSIAFESSFCYVIPFKNQARAVPKNAEITSPSLSTQNVICYG
jgi:hypothetical protein